MKKLFLFVGLFLMLASLTNAQNVAKRTVNSTSQAVQSFSAFKTSVNNNNNNNVIKTPRHCGTMEHLQWMMQQNPSLKQKMEIEENKFNDYIAAHQQELENNKTVYTLPVVVHVVYNGSAQNISDARIIEQINQTNLDWAGGNGRSMGSFSSSLRANSNISLCLAKIDPSGNSTTGITRTSTTVSSFSYSSDGVKFASSGGCNAWDPTKYFNIWVCNLESGLCGYAQFPTSGINNTYGVVVDYEFFGITGATSPYNGGGTLSHEGGHCFNLYHIWGDDNGGCTQTGIGNGSDGCADTPNQADETTGNHSGVLTDACTTTSPGIMYMNFMDYSDDADLANMTPNQVTRMQAAVSQYLSSVANYSATACSTTPPPPTSGCDTIYPASFLNTSCNMALYYADVSPYDSGYVTGQNAYLDKEKAQLYTGVANGTVSDVFVMYPIKAGTTGNTTVKIYSSNSGAPGTLLGTSTTIVKSAIDTTNKGINYNNKYHFTPAVSVSSDYFVSVVLPTGFTNGTNSLGIWGTTYSCATNVQYDRLSNDSWIAFANSNDWGTNIDMAIFPVVCTTVGVDDVNNNSSEVKLYPNPTNDEFIVDFSGNKQDATIDVYNAIGTLVKSIKSNNLIDKMTIDISDQASGIYLVNIKTQEKTIIKKISLMK